MKINLSRRERFRGLLLILAFGIALFLFELGSTGLIDETPPLFAAAGRNMSISGDWLTPSVNGLPRFDKPPLIYWLMGLGYLFPGQPGWDPLGTWSARLPSALSSILMMIFLGDTIMRWPQGEDNFPRRTALFTSLAFALSPLVMVWGRIAVSDALLCSTLGISLLCQWRRFANPSIQSWWLSWVFLGLAVLAKGPVAIVLMIITLVLFCAYLRSGTSVLIRRIRPLNGLIITTFIALPWYLMELFVEGKAFWNSFFGYHNFQRFTSVVNSHQAPWWFFLALLVIASLPFSPFLLIGLFKSISNIVNPKKFFPSKPEESLLVFASCWLIAVLLLFTSAATKLPSYWLPASPAAGIIIGLTAKDFVGKNIFQKIPWLISSFIALILGLIFLSSPYWILSINDPEMPSLGVDLLASKLLIKAAISLLTLSLICFLVSFRTFSGRLIAAQLPLVAFQLFVLLPMIKLGDKIRQLPLRQAAKLIIDSRNKDESIMMVGVVKPSMHFYTNQIVLYGGNTSRNLVNLTERLSIEKRKGWEGIKLNDPRSSPTALMVIDEQTSKLTHWQGIPYEQLGQFGIYKIWRIERINLEERANQIKKKGIRPNWQKPRPERY